MVYGVINLSTITSGMYPVGMEEYVDLLESRVKVPCQEIARRASLRRSAGYVMCSVIGPLGI